jgi:hypothetical protein
MVEILNFLIALALLGGSWLLTVRMLRWSLRVERGCERRCTCGYPHNLHAVLVNRPASMPPARHGPVNLASAVGFRGDTGQWRR